MKRTTKRFLSIFLVMMMLFSLVPSMAMAGGDSVKIMASLGVIEESAGGERILYLSLTEAAQGVELSLLNGTSQVSENLTWTLSKLDGNDVGNQNETGSTFEFKTEVAGHYGIGTIYSARQVWMDIYVGQGFASEERANVMHGISIAGISEGGIQVAPGHSVPTDRFIASLEAGTPVGDAITGLYYDEAFTRPVGDRIAPSGDVAIHPKFMLASSTVETVMREDGTATTQIIGATGTTTELTLENANLAAGSVDYRTGISVTTNLSKQDQATLVGMAQANAGAADNTVRLVTGFADGVKLKDTVAAGNAYLQSENNLFGHILNSSGVYTLSGSSSGAEYAKMLLVALGYDSGTDYSGPEWEVMINLEASTLRDVGAAGAAVEVITPTAQTKIDNENVRKLANGVRIAADGTEQFLDQNVQLTIKNSGAVITKGGTVTKVVNVQHKALNNMTLPANGEMLVYGTLICNNNTVEVLGAAESRIRDVDMADEITEYTKNNILLQAAQSMLTQANATPQGVLQLLQ